MSGDEGRDRSLSPSLNAPHSYNEALVAVLFHAQRTLAEQWTVRTRYLGQYPYAPAAGPAQNVWLTQAYAEGQRILQGSIEQLQALMRAAGEDVSTS